MATTTTISGLPVPEGSDANNVPSDMAALAAPLDGTIIRKLSTSAIAALTGPQKPAGTVVYNTTTGKLQISNGSTFTDVIDPSAYATATQGAKADAALPAASIQAGFDTVGATGGPYTVTFSPAFAGQPVVVASPVENVTDKWVVVGGVEASNFTYRTNVTAGSYVSWIAVYK